MGSNGKATQLSGNRGPGANSFPCRVQTQIIAPWPSNSEDVFGNYHPAVRRGNGKWAIYR